MIRTTMRWSWVCGLVLVAAVGMRCEAQETSLASALRTLAGLAPDACEAAPVVEEFDKHPEEPVFVAAGKLVEQRLNGTAGTALERARGAVAEGTRESVAAQPGWPEEARFRGDVVQAGPALVVTMFVRTRARWFAFGEVDGRWKQVGEDDGVLDDSPRRLMEVFGLRAGGAGAARFLAVRNFFGCAGSSGISYEVLEWNAREPGGYVARRFEAGRGVRHGRGG